MFSSKQATQIHLYAVGERRDPIGDIQGVPGEGTCEQDSSEEPKMTETEDKCERWYGLYRSNIYMWTYEEIANPQVVVTVALGNYVSTMSTLTKLEVLHTKYGGIHHGHNDELWLYVDLDITEWRVHPNYTASLREGNASCTQAHRILMDGQLAAQCGRAHP